ncbi:MAG: Gfo/Idh/MocA family oxidoreductase [Oscillospiraceae bacterium]|jgi:predicted dehydrogenase|nr:Gfo/Idh/MocA family oxidoreductase [Oscillospiraceae bacterium]
MNEFKIAIVGCGGIANCKHFPALAKIPEAKLVAFCDLIEERARDAAAKYGVPDAQVFIDYRELLEKSDAELVYVLTPNRWHSEISVAALQSGRHVMCEKPMAINYAEALRMVEAAKQSGKLLTIGYQNRYRADSLFLKDHCDRGGLGEVYFARARALRRRGVPTWGVFLDEYAQGGGPLIDIGTHALDMTLWIMNNHKPKYAVGTAYHKLNAQTETGNGFGSWDPAKFTVEDSAFGFVVMENGATVIVESSWALNTLEGGEAITALSGTLGGADMYDGLRLNGILNGRQIITRPDLGAGGVPFFPGASSDPSDVEQQIFLRAVSGEGELTVLPEQAAVVTRILDGIYESAKSGKPTYFE